MHPIHFPVGVNIYSGLLLFATNVSLKQTALNQTVYPPFVFLWEQFPCHWGKVTVNRLVVWFGILCSSVSCRIVVIFSRQDNDFICTLIYKNILFVGLIMIMNWLPTFVLCDNQSSTRYISWNMCTLAPQNCPLTGHWLSTNCRSIVNSDKWLTVGGQLVNCWSTVNRQVVNHWLTIMADSQLTADQQYCWPTIANVNYLESPSGGFWYPDTDHLRTVDICLLYPRITQVWLRMWTAQWRERVDWLSRPIYYGYKII